MAYNPTCKVFTAIEMTKEKTGIIYTSTCCLPENVGVNKKVYSQDK